MKKKNDRNLIKIIGFLLVVCIVLGKTTSVLNYKDTGGGGGWQRFYHMPQKTADVMFFGSSHAHCTVDHGLLWDQYGIAGYTLSAGSQRLDSTYYFFEGGNSGTKAKDCGRGGMGNCIGRNGVQ